MIYEEKGKESEERGRVEESNDRIIVYFDVYVSRGREDK